MKQPEPDVRHFVLFAALLAVSACTPDSSVLDPSVRPDPPPADALALDFSFFSERSPGEGVQATSWAQALNTIDIAEDQLAPLRLPAELIRDATTTTDGVLDGDVWRWAFSTVVDDAPYDGELQGSVLSNQHVWDLIVNAPDHTPVLTDYLWAKAYTPSSGFDGQLWVADAAAASGTVVVMVSWVIEAGELAEVWFTGSETSGWTLQLSDTENVLTYAIASSPQSRIVWNPVTGSGSAWTPGTGTVCWDEDLADVTC